MIHRELLTSNPKYVTDDLTKHKAKEICNQFYSWKKDEFDSKFT